MHQGMLIWNLGDSVAVAMALYLKTIDAGKVRQRSLRRNPARFGGPQVKQAVPVSERLAIVVARCEAGIR